MDSRLKKLRKEKKLTQEALAQKLLVSRQTVSNWENGRSLPDRENVIMLAELYEVSPEYLLTGKEELEAFKRQRERKVVIYTFLVFAMCFSLFVPFGALASLFFLRLWRKYLNSDFYKYSTRILLIILAVNILFIIVVSLLIF